MENKLFVDKWLICKDCQMEFGWRADDQRFLTECVENRTPHPITGVIIEKVIAPVRCPECRKKRKQFFEGQKIKS